MDLGLLDSVPEAGDPVAVDDLVMGYLARAERFAERASSVRAAAETLHTDARGQWAEALVERSGRWATGSDDAAHACRQVAEILARYAAALRELTVQAARARDAVERSRTRALAAQRNYEAAVLAAGGGAPTSWSWTDPPPFAAHPLAAAELRVWHDVVSTAATNLSSFEECCRQRRELDRDTAARLTGIDLMDVYAPGTGVDDVIDLTLVHAFTAAAAGTLTDAQLTTLTTWFDEAAKEVTDHPDDPEALRAFQTFLDAWGDDPQVMGKAFGVLGATRTVRLVHALGHEVERGGGSNQELVALARQIRISLATATSDWGPGQVKTFVGELFGPVLREDGTASIIAYLFADPDSAVMSAAFTVAMADRIDTWERIGHRRLPNGVHPPGYWLEAAAVPGSDPRYALDPAASVMGMLGAHPAEARDWLAGSTRDWTDPYVDFDRARIAYWFGERDWSLPASDGFQGVAHLWRGIQANQGPGDVLQVAALNTVVFDRISRNSQFLLTENVSDSASLHLSHVLESQFDALVEVGGMRDCLDGRLKWEVVESPFSASGVVAASVDREMVAPVLAAATRAPEGRGVVSDAVLTYEAEALNAVAAGEASPAAVLERLAVVWGVADGVATKASLAELQRASDEIRDAIGVVRIPVDASLAFVPNPIASIGITAAEDWLEKEIMQAATPQPERTPTIRLEPGEAMREYFIQASDHYRNEGTWDGHSVRTDSDVGTGPAQDAGQLVKRYEDTASAMTADEQEE